MTEISRPHRSPSFIIKRIIGSILLLAMTVVFILSGFSKIYSRNAFDGFVWTFLDLGVNSISTAGIIARVMIGFEFLLALFLLCHIFLKAFTYPAVILLLTAFTGYLGIVMLQQGNTGNCGCFGDVYAMTPLHAIYKNLIMIAVTILLIYIYPIKPFKTQEWIAPMLGMAALVAPFIIAPFSGDTQPEVVNKTINLSPLYEGDVKPNVELRKGKHIIAFLSLTCPHCRKAAYLLQVIHKQHPEIPIYIVLSGPAAYKDEFFNETHAKNVPYLLYNNTDGFVAMAGSSVPSILWVTNGFVSFKTTYYQMDPKRMLTWMKN
ncbi:MAG: hypothetical protein P4L41_04695 [Flavipsychrobacter sp.]|nr:hypothetical protein [Flavipsychrobacter sp.]